MIIECPSCKAQANLPESKEGSKVRCGECQRVYIARERGARGRSRGSSPDPTRWVIFGGAAIAIVVVIVLAKNAGGPKPVASAPVEETAPPPAEPMGWDSPAVKLVREIHDHAFTRNSAMLRTKLAGEYLWNGRAADRIAAGDTSDRSWASLTSAERTAFLEDIAADMIDGEAAEIVGKWRPFDGWIVPLPEWDEGWGIDYSGSGKTIVRARVAPEDGATELENRHVEWALVMDGGSLRAFAWRRWYAPGEEEATRGPRPKKTIKRTLTDGSLVIEGVVREIPYDDDTPLELQTRINALVSKLVDPATVKTYAIREELKAIGKPSIPPLLSQLAMIPFETEEDAVLLNLVSQTLTEITGHTVSFNAHEALGTTRERQESGLKQWFGWYDRKYKRFQGPEELAPEDDPLLNDERFKARGESERRALEKARGGR